ncbi:MAG: NFACT family protein [Armatimonadetes bacterium]|nr:NFACT family protein [Armatimonadota bacterium]
MFVDSFILAAVVHELNSVLKGGIVRSAKTVAPFGIALSLQVRNKGKIWLIASAHTRYAHIGWHHKLPKVNEVEHRETERFAEVLERHLLQARFLGAEQIDFDRLVVLHFFNITPLGERKRLALWCEIMGKHSNLVLVDEDNGLIVDSLKHLPSSMNRYREVLPGKPYLRPPSGDRKNPLTIGKDELLQITATQQISQPKDWAKIFFGMSDQLLRLMEQKVGEPLENPDAFGRALEWLRNIIEQGNFEPAIWKDESGNIVCCYPFPVPSASLQFAITSPQSPIPSPHFAPTLIEWLNSLAKREMFEQKHQSLLSNLKRNLQGLDRQLQELKQRLQEAQEAEKFRKWGDLLLTFAHEISNEAKEAVVTDYDSGQQISIPLLEGKNVTESAQYYFALYRKLKNAAETLPSVIERQQKRVDDLRKLIEQVQAANESELTEIASKIPKALTSTVETSVKTQTERNGDFLRFTVFGGYEVWVGRNAEANSKLLRTARPDDLWFHVKGAPGSHALLRVQKRGEQIPQKAIEEAAQLAAYYSSRRTSSWVEVDYTRAKYVRPAKGQKGLAFYTNFKTVAVEPKLPNF